MTASLAASPPHDLPAPGGLCAIHQPNFFPRLTTLAKLFAADYWIVLDDVQFNRRDYQHRARLAALDDPRQQRWLSLPTHLPDGRPTRIHDALMADPDLARRRAATILHQHYRPSPHWPALADSLRLVWDAFTTGRTVAVAEASTRVLLDLLGWKGEILRSSRLPARPGRSQRLADLTTLTGARSYLCGTGGMKYLQTELFTTRGITVTPFRAHGAGPWEGSRSISALRALMLLGPGALARELQNTAALQKPLIGGLPRPRMPQET